MHANPTLIPTRLNLQKLSTLPVSILNLSPSSRRPIATNMSGSSKINMCRGFLTEYILAISIGNPNRTPDIKFHDASYAIAQVQTHHPQSSSDFFKDLQSAVRNFQEALDRLSQNAVLRDCQCKLGYTSNQPKRTTAFINLYS